MTSFMFSSQLAVLALNVGLAVVLVCAAAMLLERLLPRRSLPLRHGLLCAALAAMLLSPLPIWLAGSQGWGLLPLAMDSSQTVTVASASPLAFERVSADRRETVTELEASNLVEHSGTASSASVPHHEPGRSADTTVHVGSSIPIVNRFLAANNRERLYCAANMLLMFWAAVTIWQALRLIRGLWMVNRLRRSLTVTTDPRVLKATQQAFAAYDQKACPVFESRLVHAPLCLGLRRPALIMPAGLAGSLDDEQLACVLAHEVAHVVRRDTAVALLQRLTMVAFWWHPLLRAVNRRINQLREWLCDHSVVSQRGNGLPLAMAIVQVAEWSHSRTTAIPLAAALLEDDQDLELRIIRLTETQQSVTLRLNPRSRVVLFASVVALLAVMAVPIIRAQVSESPVVATSQPAENDGDDSNAAPAADTSGEDPPTHAMTVAGRAKNQAGEPIVGATIYLVSTNAIDKHLGETRTDAEGRYEFRDLPLPLTRFQDGPLSGTFQVYGSADGYGYAWHGMRHFRPTPRPADQAFADVNQHSFSYYGDDVIKIDLMFAPPLSLNGRIVDEEGQPVSGARILLQHFDHLDTAEREYHANFREFWGLHLVPKTWRETVSADDGRFQLSGLPADTVALVAIEHPQYATQTFHAAITTQSITENNYISNSSVTIANGKEVRKPIWSTRAVRTSPLDIRVREVRRVTLRLTTEDDQQPATGVRVFATSSDKSLGLHAHGVSNADGQVELALPPGEYQLVADPPRDSDYVRTRDELSVATEPKEQSQDLSLKAGCILILEAVDAKAGTPIAGVSFWTDSDRQRGARVGVQSSTTYVDNPVTNEKGELRAVVQPGTRRYGAGFSPLPNGYKLDGPVTGELVNCSAGQTVRVRFLLKK